MSENCLVRGDTTHTHTHTHTHTLELGPRALVHLYTIIRAAEKAELGG